MHGLLTGSLTAYSIMTPSYIREISDSLKRTVWEVKICKSWKCNGFSVFSNHMFFGVWGTERLIPGSHLEVDRDRENNNERARSSGIWPEKGGEFSTSQIYNLGGSWVPRLHAGPEYHSWENRTVFDIIDSRDVEAWQLQKDPQKYSMKERASIG